MWGWPSTQRPGFALRAMAARSCYRARFARRLPGRSRLGSDSKTWVSISFMACRRPNRCSRLRPPTCPPPFLRRGRWPLRPDAELEAGSEASGAIVAGRLAAMRVNVSRDISDGFDAAKFVGVDRDLVAIAEDRDQLDHVDRVPDDLVDRRSEGDLALLDGEGPANRLQEVVAHVARARYRWIIGFS